MFKRILVPLDGSTRAESALPVAARLARATGGTIVLLKVVSPPIEYGAYMAPLPTYTQEVLEAELTEARQYLTSLTHLKDLAGLPTEVEAIPGSAALTVLMYVQLHKINIVIMTSHGHTGFKRWVLGSVAQKLARHCAVPVLVLREGETTTLGMHSLHACISLDGSVLAKTAIEPAAQLVAAMSAPGHGSLHLIRVVRFHTTELEHGKQGHPDLDAREQAKYKAKKYMLSIVEQLKEGPVGALNLPITWSVAVDMDVAEALINVAEKGLPADSLSPAVGVSDFIAMATHGRGGFQRWAIGSVTERVLGATRLPLLVIRPAGAATHGDESDEENIGAELPIGALKHL